MSLYPTAKELAEEARRALAANPMTPREHFEFLIARGIIDRQGRVLCNRLFGDDEPLPEAPSPANTNGTAPAPASNGSVAPTTADTTP